MNRGFRNRGLFHLAAELAVVVALLSLAIANIRVRATWTEVEDGVLWSAGAEGLVAREVASASPAALAGVRTGDILEAVNGTPVDAPADVTAKLHAGSRGQWLTYTIVRTHTPEVVNVRLAPIPSGARGLYYVLASVGIFSLFVGAAVRIRRPDNQATLHFFWLTIAFFGVLAFSFSGKFDTLDWVVYWADAWAMLLLPPLFVHFTLVFPERPDSWIHSDAGRTALPLLYLPALLLGGARVATLLRAHDQGVVLSSVITLLERGELVCLAAGLMVGLAIMVRALGRVRSVTARRQLRWIVWGTALGGLPFACGYAVPYVLGFSPMPGADLTAVLLGLIPLAFASALVRYRLMDVEVIIKRGLVYAAAVAAIAAMYAVLLKLVGDVFFGGNDTHNSVIALLATLVVVLLSRPVKNGIQTGLDRVYYRDRYDYRRALVGFARDLNSDLDLSRLSERLVHRVMETLVVDRMALLLAPACAGRDGEFVTIAHIGFPGAPPALPRASEVGARLTAGHTLTLDDPLAHVRLDGRDVDFWREAGIHYFIPCVSKEGMIAVMALGRKASAEPLSSEDMALLAAVAAQAATALENGRLYRQLRVKADELERLREFSENILESLNDGLAVVDRDDRIIRWNRRLEELYGIRHEDAVSHGLDEIFEPAFLEVLRGARRESPEGAAFYRVPLLTRHEGARRLLVNVATTPLRDSEGAIAGSIVIIEDISARVQLEEQLQISEKMASIGLLAAGVAHEVNTPLTGISSFTQMLLQGAAADDPRTKVLEKIERQTFRAAKIVNGLLNLARPTQTDSGPVDVNAVINDVLSLLEHQLRTGSIQVRKELSAAPLVVQGIEYKLQQVFLNLFLNARDAMPKGGWLTVVSRTDASGAMVEIADTGSGIPAEQLSRIYDPFFTTKEIGKGTGLGLSITYGILQEHEGTITCDSSIGHGTRFTLSLPLVASPGFRCPQARDQASLIMARSASDTPATRPGSILIIDDEEIMREILDTLLSQEGYEVRLASHAAEGLELIRSMPFDVVIVDMMMPGMDGISALDEIKKLDDDLPVLMITAYASVENAIAAMKRGAYDYITKPFKNDEVLVVLRNALAQRRLVAENRALRQNLQARANRFGEIVGRSARMRQVFDLIIQAAPSRATILINGESGTGKELVARSLHQNSSRSDRAFITVNSGNLPPDLLESNLFGHVKGAFTGAVYPKKGLFELADKGTIFFDEIGNIPLETQAKLLRVIQEREFMRLGGVDTIKVDVRIIAATNVDLRHMMEEGKFREDLYYRLHVITVQLPALRERKDDVPLLVQTFLEKYGKENQKTHLEMTGEALDLLQEYDWPGNVRELENVIERAVVLSTGAKIDADLVPDHVRSSKRFQMPQFIVPPEGISFREVITDFEKRLIESTLEAAGGVQKRAAELLHIKPTTLNEMIKRHDIRPRRKRGALGRPGADLSDAEDIDDGDPVGVLNRE